jgi:rod shape-determining protein MreD
MIMRPGQPLLLPVNPLFIWVSLATALLLNFVQNMGLWGRDAWAPDVLAVVLVFWSVHQPLRISIGVAFFFGLCMDVHQTALLGQHALSYTALIYFATTIHRRVLWFSVPTQAIQVLPLFVAAHAIELGIRMLGSGVFPGWQLLLAPALEAALWPVVSVILLLPQRRAPDPDKNRPL